MFSMWSKFFIPISVPDDVWPHQKRRAYPPLSSEGDGSFLELPVEIDGKPVQKTASSSCNSFLMETGLAYIGLLLLWMDGDG
jgi:hypothetical protein